MNEKVIGLSKRGLNQIEIGGEVRPYQVNSIRQTQAFCKQMAIELDEYWTQMAKMATNGVLTNQVIVVTFVYSTLVAGALKERKIIDFDYENVLDWFEDATADEAAEFTKPIQLFTEILNKAAQDLETQEPKKA